MGTLLLTAQRSKRASPHPSNFWCRKSHQSPDSSRRTSVAIKVWQCEKSEKLLFLSRVAKFQILLRSLIWGLVFALCSAVKLQSLVIAAVFTHEGVSWLWQLCNNIRIWIYFSASQSFCKKWKFTITRGKSYVEERKWGTILMCFRIR